MLVATTSAPIAKVTSASLSQAIICKSACAFPSAAEGTLACQQTFARYLRSGGLMLHKLLLTFGILALLGPSTASAQQVVPPHINLHNGYIVVINNIHTSRLYSNGRTEPWSAPEAYASLKWAVHSRRVVVPYGGGHAYLNDCCIAAGTRYTFRFYQGSVEHDLTVQPKLCNIRGIPFGYAVVELSGSYQWLQNSTIPLTHGEPVLRDLHAPCPTG
jgi:hypothetical protein